MKTSKKLISLILSVVMLAAMLVVPASASTAVYKEWTFEDNQVPASIGKGGGITLSAANGCLTVTSDTQWRMFNVGSGAEPLSDAAGNKGFYVADYPYLKFDMTFKPTSAKSNPYMIGLSFLDENFATIGTKYYATDDDGKTFIANEKGTYVFDMTKAKEYADDSATLTNLATKKVHIVQVAMFRLGAGSAVIDSIQITSLKEKPEATISMTSPAAGAVVYDSDTVDLTAEVTGSTPKKVDFLVDGAVVGTKTEEPYTMKYQFSGEQAHTVLAVATLADDTEVKNSVTITSVQTRRWDFDTMIPPNLTYSGSGYTKSISDGALKFDVTATGRAINLGHVPMKSYAGKDYRYLKVRAKIPTAAPASNARCFWIGWYDESVTFKAAANYYEDVNGTEIKYSASNYTTYVFDLSLLDAYSDSTIGFVAIQPLSALSSGTIYIDWIEITNDPTVGEEEATFVTLTAPTNGTTYYSGKQTQLTANIEGPAPKQVEFFVDGISAGVVNEAPYAVDYAFTGEQTHTVVAEATLFDDSKIQSSVNVTSINEMRMDFNSIKPVNLQGSAVLENDGTISFNSTIYANLNVGSLAYPIKQGGFDPNTDKYLKLRAKFDGADVGQYTFAAMLIDAAGTTLSTILYEADENGKRLNSEYQELVFDLTKGSDLTGKTAALVQIYPLRSLASGGAKGTVTIDWIEITDDPYVKELSIATDEAFYIEAPELSANQISTYTLLKDDKDEVNDTCKVTYIAVKYEAGRVTKVKSNPVDLTEGVIDRTPIDVTDMDISTADSLVVFVWNTKEQMKPVAEKTVLMESGISAINAKLAGAFMDSMVLQRDMPIHVWGTSDAEDGASLLVSFGGNTVSATVTDGAWETTLPAVEANANAQELVVTSLSGEEKISDVLVGDVYFVGGQSNATYALIGTDTWEADRAGATEEDNIRILFSTNGQKSAGYATTARKDPFGDAVWQVAKNVTEAEVGSANYGKTLVNFSAIGYYFADTLRADGIDVPIGLISIAHSGATLDQLSPLSVCADSADAKKAQSYNGLIAPVEKMTVAGMLWYQGESDSATQTAVDSYADRFGGLVDYLRGTTGNSDMPVFMVQLSSHSLSTDSATDGTVAWNIPQFRAMQSEMIDAGTIENLYMVPSLDKGWKQGDTDVAHPKYKKPIGERLAKVAENVLYNKENILAPKPISVEFGKGYCTITFDQNLTYNLSVAGFELIKDGVAYPARGEAYDNMVDISVSDEALCNDIADGVRYAFYQAAATSVANVTGTNGLPLGTFAIDNTDVTVKARDIAMISRGAVDSVAE